MRSRHCSAILLLFGSLTLAQSTAHAQEGLILVSQPCLFPRSPLPTQVGSQLGASGPQQAGTGEISGTVLDTNGDVVQGALVTLSGSFGFTKRTLMSGITGSLRLRVCRLGLTRSRSRVRV